MSLALLYTAVIVELRRLREKDFESGDLLRNYPRNNNKKTTKKEILIVTIAYE